MIGDDGRTWDLARKTKQLHALIGHIRADYDELIRVGLIEPVEGISESENMHTFFGLAEDLAHKVVQISADLDREVDEAEEAAREAAREAAQ